MRTVGSMMNDIAGGVAIEGLVFKNVSRPECPIWKKSHMEEMSMVY